MVNLLKCGNDEGHKMWHMDSSLKEWHNIMLTLHTPRPYI